MQKTIVITGAGRGIGLALTKILSVHHKVIALSRNLTHLQHLNQVTPVYADFSEQNFTQHLNRELFGKVDVLIHNAGTLINKPFETLTNDDFQAVYQVNVFAVAALTQWLLPQINAGSHIVNISSMGGVQGSAKFAGLAAYSSSKGALLTLTEVLAEELKKRQISVNGLALGAVQTEMLAEAFPNYKAPVTADEMATFIAEFALQGHQFFNGKILPVALTTP